MPMNGGYILHSFVSDSPAAGFLIDNYYDILLL